MSDRGGYRGYVASRPIFDRSVPQHVQNIVIRDYAARRGLQYLLSATEYAMPDSHLMLEGVIDELPRLRGVICYSIFMLPRDRTQRQTVYDRVLGCGAELHSAVEELALRGRSDIGPIEDLWLVQDFMARRA
jgi:sporadic carbohydrate cluster protein (TIGR04323 family)